jgi:hypothetical protein
LQERLQYLQFVAILPVEEQRVRQPEEAAVGEHDKCFGSSFDDRVVAPARSVEEPDAAIARRHGQAEQELR